MEYKIIFSSEKIIRKDFSRIPKKNMSSIFEKIDELSILWVDKANIKKLNNYKLCNFRLRLGDYRILFDLIEEKNEIVIFRVLHRSKLY